MALWFDAISFTILIIIIIDFNWSFGRRAPACDEGQAPLKRIKYENIWILNMDAVRGSSDIHAIFSNLGQTATSSCWICRNHNHPTVLMQGLQVTLSYRRLGWLIRKQLVLAREARNQSPQQKGTTTWNSQSSRGNSNTCHNRCKATRVRSVTNRWLNKPTTSASKLGS